MEGCFIVFEGIDGSGKSTQVTLLEEKLQKNNYEVEVTKEPTETGPIGKLIQDILLKNEKITNEALALLFAADRADHTRRIILPALNKGNIIISDRYVYSSLAYQSKGITQINLSWLKIINKFIVHPDIVIFLDIPPEVGLQRLRIGQIRVIDDNFFENIKKLDRIKDAYYHILNLEKPISVLTDFQNSKNNKKKKYNFVQSMINNTIVIKLDGMAHIEDLHKQISNFVLSFLRRKKVSKIPIKEKITTTEKLIKYTKKSQ